MAYAILRFAKLKTEAEVGGSGAHMMRTQPTPNANPGVSNRVLVGSTDPAKDVDTRLAAATQRRKNSVLAIEVLASASPEWFVDATKAQKAEWVRSTRSWIEGHFGKENVAHLQLHLDESTPHITGFIVPVDPDSQRLNAARWLDGSAKLADMQTAYAKAVEPLGLVRGLEGSDATHTTIRQFYGAMRSPDVAPIAMPKLAVPPAMLRETTRSDWAAEESAKVKAKLTPAVQALRAQARQGIVASRKAKSYQATAERFREAARAARDVPLQEVAERLGLTRDRTDKEKWVDVEGRVALTLTGQKWFDHKAQTGRGGAIDLVQHVMACDFPQAVSWLGHGVGPERTAAAVVARTSSAAVASVDRAMAEKPPFAPPLPCPEGSPYHQRVGDYLTRQRGLDLALVNRLAEEGKLYADVRGNAVFPALQPDGRPGGAEMRGTGSKPFHGLSSGSSREVCFEVETRPGDTSPRKLVLVESAIDAISYAQIHHRENLTVASTAGARPSLPQGLAQRLGQFSEVVVAYDDDAVGRGMAAKLMAALRAAGVKLTQAVPFFGKDWNDSLRHAQELARQRAAEPRAAVSAPRPARTTPAEPYVPRGPR